MAAVVAASPAPERWALALLADLLRPRARLTVSQWADANRVLAAKASSEPGPWRTARNELSREPMDALSIDAPGQRVVLMKPGQGGGTEVALNWIGYIADHVRIAKPMAVFVPTDTLRDDWVVQRLRPMFETTVSLRAKVDVSKSRDGSNRLDRIDYPGGILFVLSAGSGGNLESRPICFWIADEVDRFPVDVSGRGDPLKLMETRQSTFPRRKELLLSTPEVEGASRIAFQYEQSDQRRRYLPCPHCGEYQVLEWEQMQWTPDHASVWYTCALNGCVIEERDKPAMLAAGQWRPTYPDRAVRGYWWNALYAPLGLGYSWAQLVAQWLAAQGDDRALQVFINERLARVWRDKRTAIDPADLGARAEPYPLREISPGVGLITAGVDTQDDRLAVQIVGWGPGGSWWVLDYVELPGETGQLFGPDGRLSPVYAALTELLARPLTTADGRLGAIEAVAHDMAGHSTEAVKAFARQTRQPRYLAVMGSRHRLNVVLSGPRKVDYSHLGKLQRHGMRYHQVGTELAKDQLFDSLRTDADRPPAERRAHYPLDLVPPLPEQSAYLAGLMSEVWNPKRLRYEPRRDATRRNEPLDTWVYALAAAHHPEIRVDRLRPSDWAARLRRYGGESPPAAQPAAPPVSRETPPPEPAPVPAVRAPRANSRGARGGWAGRWK